jgi:hypothetical protein
MVTQSKVVILAIATLLTVIGGTVGQDGGSGSNPPSQKCQNKMASQVQATSENLGSPKTCGIGVVVFGVGGGIVGEECFPLVVTTPAHQECKGRSNEGTKCVPDADLIVEKAKCKCGGLVIPIFQIGVPTTCECGKPTAAGTIEDAKTVECPS